MSNFANKLGQTEADLKSNSIHPKMDAKISLAMIKLIGICMQLP